MKKLKYSLFILVSMLVLIIPISAEDNGIVGKSLRTEFVVEDNGIIKVIETLEVNFVSPHQGIFITRPQRYEMDFGDGVQNYYFPIKNFQMITNQDTDIESSNDGLVIRVGTPGMYLSGNHTYSYSYEMHTQDITNSDSNLVGLDLFYLNLVSNWEFPIESVSLKVDFPKDFNEKVLVYGPNSNLNAVITSNTVEVDYSNLKPYEAITIEIPFKDGYFVFPSNDYVFLGLGIISLVCVLALLLYPKYGKEYPLVETLMFKGPDGISSAEAGYIFRGHTTDKDIVSLIVYWASKGYVKLIELEDSDSIEIQKLKDLLSENDVEIAIFKRLFQDGDITSTDALNMKFGSTVQYGITHLADRFRLSKDKKIFNMASSSLKVGLSLAMIVSFGLVAGAMNYKLIPMTFNFVIGLIIGSIFGTVLVVGGLIALSRDGITVTRSSRLVTIPYIISFFLATYFMNQLIFKDSIYEWAIIGVMVLVLMALYTIANMGKRTEIGIRYYGEILGLERFINTAEIERLKMFVEETPTLFYDILPYAYALGLTDKWIKQFETIAIQQPDWYQTSTSNIPLTNILLMNRMSQSLSNLNSTMTSIPAPQASTGGGKGFGSGNFGGGSGGGFSGGGFGGGGGGGW